LIKAWPQFPKTKQNLHSISYSQAGFAAQWAREIQFTPQMDETLRQAKYGRLQKAVAATMHL